MPPLRRDGAGLAGVRAVVNIVRQGRSALVTTMQMYKILALSCLISAFCLSVLYLDGIKYGDTCVQNPARIPRRGRRSSMDGRMLCRAAGAGHAGGLGHCRQMTIQGVLLTVCFLGLANAKVRSSNEATQSCRLAHVEYRSSRHVRSAFAHSRRRICPSSARSPTFSTFTSCCR